jgi:starch-binding outer membrane protein, SusD/RagB family
MYLMNKHILIGFSVFLLLLSSCKKTFDLKPINELDETQVYLTVADADAAVVGLYGKFQGLAERYILLNELRADMVEYTTNADVNLQQLSTHSVTHDNPYASPRLFYEFILNCNDVLKNFDIMKRDNRLKVAEYDQRYSDVVSLRSFVYLQLGIHYGEVPYITNPLVSLEEIKNASNFPRLSFNALLDTLIGVNERTPFKEDYPVGSLNTSVDGYNTSKFFIPKKIILGDLHLWKGNYLQAATYYRQVMETATALAFGEAYYSKYRVAGLSAGSNDHWIQYSRANDAASLVTETQWRYMFERPQDQGFDWEWIWVIPFDNRYKPENPFIKLFSPIGGSYLLKPSQQAIDMWNSQTQRAGSGTGPGLPYDARGQLSWKNLGGQPTIMKYLYNYIQNTTNLPVNPLVKNGKWFLFRQTQLHLRFAEAANRLGRSRLACGLFSNNLRAVFPVPSTTTDVTQYQGTHAQSVFADTYPFDFDARNGNAPYFRSDWYRHLSIRGRANLLPYNVIATSLSDSMMQVEAGLVQETGLENGFEGTRWPDLLRVALRRNEPAFLADKIYDKLRKDGVANAAEVRTKLMNKANWYLPFKL